MGILNRLLGRSKKAQLPTPIDPAWRCPCGSSTEDLEVKEAAMFVRERNGSVRMTMHLLCVKCGVARKIKLVNFDALEFFRQITGTLRFQGELLQLTIKHRGKICPTKRQ